MPELISTKKRNWVTKNKPRHIKGTALNPNAASEARYYQTLHKLIAQMCYETEQTITDLFSTSHAQTYFAEDASISSQARIIMNALIDKFQPIFNLAAKPLATRMTGEASRSSASALEASLKKLSGGLTLKTDILTGDLKDILSATIAENVALIKSISAEYLLDVQGAVMRSITTGNGLADLVPFLKKHEGITLRRARIIARDQTRKAFSNINFARMDKIGITEYEWLHSAGGQKPRKLHQRMSGKIYRIDQPPIIDEKTGQRGKPGDLINCFVGSTNVSLGNGCLNLWRYWHDGQLIDLRLSNGELVSCTPNHPILTSRGWLPAYKIEEGDDLACGQTENSHIVEDKKANNIITFDDLFEALIRGISGKATCSASEFNFHGDIPKGKVDSVGGYHQLANGVQSPTCKELEEFIFSRSETMSDNSLLSFFSKVLQAGGASILRKFDSLVFSECRHSQFACATSIPQQDAVFSQNAAYNVTRTVPSFREKQNAFSRFIVSNNLGSGGINILNNFHGWKRIIELLTQRIHQMSRTHSFFPDKRAERHPSIKGLASVVQKSVRIAACHVYTMETIAGWYTVTSAGVISKNCKCRAVPVIKFNEGE